MGISSEVSTLVSQDLSQISQVHNQISDVYVKISQVYIKMTEVHIKMPEVHISTTKFITKISKIHNTEVHSNITKVFLFIFFSPRCMSFLFCFSSNLDFLFFSCIFNSRVYLIIWLCQLLFLFWFA